MPRAYTTDCRHSQGAVQHRNVKKVNVTQINAVEALRQPRPEGERRNRSAGAPPAFHTYPNNMNSYCAIANNVLIPGGIEVEGNSYVGTQSVF